MSYVSLSNIISDENSKEGRATTNYVDNSVLNTFNILNNAGLLGDGFKFNNGIVDVESMKFLNDISNHLIYTYPRYVGGQHIYYYANYKYNNDFTMITTPISSIPHIGGYSSITNNVVFLTEISPYFMNDTNTNVAYYSRVNGVDNLSYFNRNCLLSAGWLYSNTNFTFDAQSCYPYNAYNIDYIFYGSPSVLYPYVGNRAIRMVSAYDNCNNLVHPACGNNIIDMRNAYQNCINMWWDPVCGEKVIQMSRAYCNCINLKGSPVCGNNVMFFEYAYENCYNLYFNGKPVMSDSVINACCCYKNCRYLTGEPMFGNNVEDCYYAYDNCYSLSNSNIFIYARNIKNFNGCFSNKNLYNRYNIYVINGSATNFSITHNSLLWGNNELYIDTSNRIAYNNNSNIYIYWRTLEEMKALDTNNWYSNGVHK